MLETRGGAAVCQCELVRVSICPYDITVRRGPEVRIGLGWHIARHGHGFRQGVEGHDDEPGEQVVTRNDAAADSWRLTWA